jgi:hypothetical protein
MPFLSYLDAYGREKTEVFFLNQKRAAESPPAFCILFQPRYRLRVNLLPLNAQERAGG